MLVNQVSVGANFSVEGVELTGRHAGDLDATSHYNVFASVPIRMENVGTGFRDLRMRKNTQVGDA